MIIHIIYVITIIFGIIIGKLLFDVYNVKFHGPNSAIVKRKIHEKNNTCYIFEPHVYMCPI